MIRDALEQKTRIRPALQCSRRSSKRLFTFFIPKATKEVDVQIGKTAMLMSGSENPAVLDAARVDPDLPLVRRFLAGEERAFDELVTRHQSYVYNVCLQILGNQADAEDAAQDVFVAAYKALPRFRMRSKISTWIYRIAVNQCVSRLRRRRAEVRTAQEAGERPTQAGQVEKRRLVRDLVQRLAPHYRAVLVLKYYREFSYQEIAEILGWSPDKVKCYLHRARNIFKRIYEAENRGEL